MACRQRTAFTTLPTSGVGRDMNSSSFRTRARSNEMRFLACAFCSLVTLRPGGVSDQAFDSQDLFRTRSNTEIGRPTFSPHNPNC